VIWKGIIVNNSSLREKNKKFMDVKNFKDNDKKKGVIKREFI
jgi:hypothetical protein